MKTAIIVLDEKGEKWGEQIALGLTECSIIKVQRKGELKDITAEIFSSFNGAVFIMALGIVVRMIAPHIKSKYSDPAVVVLDAECRYAISLLSGHEGGANGLAYKVAALVGAEPVITTGTETRKKYIIGIGCRRGVKKIEVIEAVREFLAGTKIDIAKIRTAATISLKKDEEGLIQAMEELGIPVVFLNREEIRKVRGPFSFSPAAENQLNIQGVCEPCAWIAARDPEMVQPKTVYPNITLSLVREDSVKGS